MYEVTNDVKAVMEKSGINFSLPKELALAVWKRYYTERDAGHLTIKVLWFSKDVSGLIAQLLTKWFGPDPFPAGPAQPR